MDNLTFFIFPAVALVLQSVLFLVQKNVFVRLIPTVISFGFTLAFVIMTFASSGWDRLGALLLALLAGETFAACILVWIVWAIVRLVKKAKSKKSM